jgi:hypothetical protein
MFHADGRTHDEANDRFSQFCERAQQVEKQHGSCYLSEIKSIPQRGK